MKIIEQNNFFVSQLYLLFNHLQTDDLTELFSLKLEAFQKRQVVSVLISVLALAISFTVNYRENKENSLGLVSTLTFFVYIIMSVVARMLCFQIFAFSLVTLLTFLKQF